MDTETIKLNLITWLLNLQDESVLRKLLALKEKAESKFSEPAITEALIHRVEESNRDIEAGGVFPIEEVMKRIVSNGDSAKIDIFETRQNTEKVEP